jgi:predicted transcriptional regulator
MKYRSSTEIIDSILHSVETGATKTHIMYRAYLSYSQLKDYLKLLQERDLIRYEEGSQLYHLSERGLRFINVYEEIKELVPTADERNNSSATSTPSITRRAAVLATL